jgi:prophage regulatory protein
MSNTRCRKFPWSKGAVREWMADSPSFALELDVPRKKQSRILSYRELKSVKGLNYSRPTLARWEEKGEFPQRIQISPGRIGWYEHEVDEHVAEKAEARHLSVRNKRKPGI